MKGDPITISIPLIPLFILAALWISGWITWLAHQDNRAESDALFNLTLGLATWPLLLLAHLISTKSRYRS